MFVIPSHQEGLCIAALEAMACGCPVVSTRCGGPEEFVVEGRTGYLVPASPEAMADRRIDHRRPREAPDSASRAEFVIADYGKAGAAKIFWAASRQRFKKGRTADATHDPDHRRRRFIGVNAAEYFADQGWRIAVLDNLSRRGTEENLRWLNDKVKVDFHKLDIRDAAGVERVVRETKPDALLHLAAQVAVTTSVSDPREDFEVNALGTFNVLEAVRKGSPQTFIINASTNKVYGKMEEIEVEERNGRYEYRDQTQGVSESQPLDFHSPYGCSKGVADQYTLDYARIYGLDTVSFRQSCIYGPRQFGIEDQGWVAWFIIAAVSGKQITIYGDGKQIRDVLHVKDVARAYLAAY